MEDIEIFKKNCEEYAKSSKGADVLRGANGKNDYKEIATLNSMHSTTVSSLLRKAAKLGIAKKIKNGNYKRVPGVLAYMPKNKLNTLSHNSTSELVSKLSKKIEVKLKPDVPAGVKIPPRIAAQTNKMISAYNHLYYTENVLRELIRQVFSSEEGWWQKRVPSDIKKAVEDAIDKTPYHVTRREDELEYTHLGQLKVIIIKNWEDFKNYLNEKDKAGFSATINKAIPSRNAIGHCIPLKGGDLKVVEIRFNDVLKMIK